MMRPLLRSIRAQQIVDLSGAVAGFAKDLPGVGAVFRSRREMRDKRALEPDRGLHGQIDRPANRVRRIARDGRSPAGDGVRRHRLRNSQGQAQRRVILQSMEAENFPWQKAFAGLERQLCELLLKPAFVRRTKLLKQ